MTAILDPPFFPFKIWLQTHYHQPPKPPIKSFQVNYGKRIQNSLKYCFRDRHVKFWDSDFRFVIYDPKPLTMTAFTLLPILKKLHSNLHLARVSVVAYAKWRLSFNVSECKQSGPYELHSTVCLTAAGKRITRCLFDEWKRVQEMCPLAHTHVER